MPVHRSYRLRTGDELVARFVRSGEPTNFERQTIAPYMRWDQARGVMTERVWQQHAAPYTVEHVHDTAAAYLDYAWHVALTHRNVESQRSVIKLNTFCWLLGDEHRDFFAGTEGLYGVTALHRIARFLAHPDPPTVTREFLDSPPTPISVPDTARLERMTAGQPCVLLCEGCTWKPPA